jgi:hypothetical protein
MNINIDDYEPATDVPQATPADLYRAMLDGMVLRDSDGFMVFFDGNRFSDAEKLFNYITDFQIETNYWTLWRKKKELQWYEKASKKN